MLEQRLFVIPDDTSKNQVIEMIRNIIKLREESLDDKTIKVFFEELKNEYTNCMRISTNDYYRNLKAEHAEYFLLYKNLVREVYERQIDFDEIVTACKEVLEKLGN